MQALIVTENFDDYENFFCLKKCPILTPLEMNIYLLKKNNIEEIIVFASDHRVEVKNFLEKKNLDVKFISSEDSMNFASLMRVIF